MNLPEFVICIKGDIGIEVGERYKVLGYESGRWGVGLDGGGHGTYSGDRFRVPGFVCLEGLKEGNQFYTSYSLGDEPGKLGNGEVAYKVLGYADSSEEALGVLGYGKSVEEDRKRIADYLYKTGMGMFDRGTCERFAELLKI